MFYSQFILAKKGPLGTIWIAAHLERKLRKNQVADTDIGVSVDSILFPDVPIALRLSSHLLLGVVRIYSKKVNYLFHDCSEALVKIKQAFRSTAVDLPPEESTAPYHSITLPETFDLENFELPDSALLDSNFVDHHVSTREQITLQDTVNGTAFPTSKFGLDERFGDGDASQIGLELDEELFMDKNISQQHDEFSMDSKVSGVHHGETSVPSSSMGIDVQFGYDEEKVRKVPNELSELLSNNYERNCFSSVEDLRRDVDSSHRHGYNIQTPDLNEVFLPDCHTALSPLTPHIPFTPEEAQIPCLMEPAQAPSTPGLLEEVIPSNFQEAPALSPQEKAGAYVESGRSGLCSSPCMEVECAETGNKSGVTSVALGRKSEETAEELPPYTSDLIGSMSESLLPINSNLNLTKTDIVCLVSGAENQQSGLIREAENTADHRHGNEEAIFHSGYSHETATLSSTPKLAASFETDPVTSNICTDDLDLLGVISDVKGAPLKDNNEPSDIGDLGCVEVGGSCITINTSAVGADFVLRSCGSNMHPPSSHIVDGALGETSELFPRDHCCNFRTPVGEDALHIYESSYEVQGEDSRYTNGRVINLDGQQTSVCTPSVVKAVAAKPDELTVVLSNVFQLDHVNYSSSSEFLGPDKMLGPACDVDLPNQGLQITCKGVTESDGSVDRTSSHCSRKRRIMDSSATLQTGSSAKLSGIPRSRRIADYIPDDDDVLASILVGRKAPSLMMSPTPCLSKASSLKRPRTISKLGMPKRRKVLVDETMVLQADAIRQQLINTEDIRRMRKKAPCSRPEIWRIYIGAMEDEIFYHSTLTGIPLQQNSLNDQYVLQRDPHVKTSGEAVSSRVSEFVNDTGVKEMDGSMLSVPGIIVKMGGPSRISASDTMQSHEGGTQCDVHDQLEEVPVRPQEGLLSNDQVAVISSMEVDAVVGANSIIQETLVPEIDKSASFLEKPDDKSINLAERSAYTEAQNPLNTPNDGSDFAECATTVGINGDTAFSAVVSETSIQAENVCIAVGATINEEEKTVNAVEAKNSESHYTGLSSDVGTNEVVVTDESAFVVQGDEALEKDLGDEKRPITDAACGELPNIVSFESSIEHAPSTMGENSCIHEFNLEGGLDMDNIPVDIGVARDSSDFCSAINDNYTGFLNVDDDADFDEEENEAPNPEEAQSLENSGWSARTRGVARYLKILFDEESGRGRKAIAVDRLLAGKTRKEASRMFFETLVLKTRDYIQVQQEKPFEYINIKPRTKLLVSEF